MTTKFADLWKSSSLIQGIMALAAMSAIIYLAIAAQPIPDVLIGALMAIIGYYFCTKEHIKET